MLCTLFKLGQCNVKKVKQELLFSRYIWSRWMMRSHRKHKLNIFSLCLQFLRRNHTPNGRLSPSGESPPLPPPLTSTAPVTYIGLHEDQDLTVGVFAINPGANVRGLFSLFYSNLNIDCIVYALRSILYHLPLYVVVSDAPSQSPWNAWHP